MNVSELLAKADGLLKGDLPGHPFRGNQWTDGSAGGAQSAEDSFRFGGDGVDKPVSQPVHLTSNEWNKIHTEAAAYQCINAPRKQTAFGERQDPVLVSRLANKATDHARRAYIAAEKENSAIAWSNAAIAQNSAARAHMHAGATRSGAIMHRYSRSGRLPKSDVHHSKMADEHKKIAQSHERAEERARLMARIKSQSMEDEEAR